MRRILKKNKLLKVLSVNSLSVISSFILGVFSTKIISVFLGTSGMTVVGSFRNFSTMLKSISTLGISTSIVRLFIENKTDKNELSLLFSTFFWLFLMLSLCLGLGVYFLATPIAIFLEINVTYILPIQLFGLFLPLIVLNVFWLAIFNGLERFKTIVLMQVLSNIGIFALTALLIWTQQLNGALLAITLSEIILVLITYIFVNQDKTHFRFELQPKIQKKYLKVIGKFSVMAMLSAVLVPLTLMLIRKELILKYSMEEAGIWDAISRFSGFYMMLFSSGLSMYYMPKLASITTEKEFKIQLIRYFRTFVPLFLIVIIVIYFLKDILLSIAFSKDFLSMNSLIHWQMLGDLFRVMALAFGYQILIKAQWVSYFIVELVFNLSYLLFSYLWISQLGTEGALLAYIVASIISMFTMLIIFRKLLFALPLKS